MSKIMIGVATAALWFALSHAANAERDCRQVCDHGTCMSKCVEHPDSGAVIRDHDRSRDDRPGSGIDLHEPGVGVEIGR